MLLLRYLLSAIIMNFILLYVLCDFHGSINALAESQESNLEDALKTLEDTSESKTAEDRMDVLPSNTSVSSINPSDEGKHTDFDNNHPSSEETPMTEELNVENGNSTRYMRKLKFDLGVNRIVNSKRTNLMKHRMELLSDANNMRQSLRRSLNGQRSLSHADIDQIKADILSGLESSRSSESLNQRTPLMKLDIQNDWTPMYHESQFTYSGLEGNRNERKIGDSDNCSGNSDGCLSGKDAESKNISLSNSKEENPKAELSETRNFDNQGFKNENNVTYVVKETGMEDKTFNVGHSTHGHRGYMMSDKLNHVFPFLSGVGRGIKKLLAPKTKVVNIYPKYDYDTKRGVFYISEHGSYVLSPKPKPPVHLSPSIHDSPVVFESETPDLHAHFPHTKTKTEISMIHIPYNVEVEKKVPYIVKVPYDNPVPVHIPQPYGVPVEKIVPYPVRVEVPDPYPVTKIVKKPFNVYIEHPVPVEMEKPYPLVKEKLNPYVVQSVVKKPYLEHVHNDFSLEIPNDKNIPSPVLPNDHQNIFRDDVEKEIHDSIPQHVPNDLLVSQSSNTENKLTPQYYQMMSMFHSRRRPTLHGTQTSLGSNMGNNIHIKNSNDNNKNYAYYSHGSRHPKRTKLIPQSNRIRSATKDIMKIKANRGLTEVQFIDLMKQKHAKEAMRQNQILGEKIKQNQLHSQQIQALIKQNQELRASLALPQEQMKLTPLYQTKNLYPKFKPLQSILNPAVLQKNNYNTPNNYNELSPHFQYPSQSSTLQYSNNINLAPSSNEHQHVFPQSEAEMIDAHLKQLYKNDQNNVEIIKSQEAQSFSYTTPLSVNYNLSPQYYTQPNITLTYPEQPLLLVHNAHDSDVGFSQRENLYDTNPNIINQDPELYKLHLEYQVLDNLLKNFDQKKAKLNENSVEHKTLVDNLTPDNVEKIIKFSQNDTMVLNRIPSNVEKPRPTTKEPSNIIGHTGTNYAWSNLEKPNKQFDNYTRVSANEMKESLKNRSYTSDVKSIYEKPRKTIFNNTFAHDSVFHVAQSTQEPVLSTENTKSRYIIQKDKQQSAEWKKEKPAYDSYSLYPHKAVPFHTLGNYNQGIHIPSVQIGAYNIHDFEKINHFVSPEGDDKNVFGIETVTVGRPVYNPTKVSTESYSEWVPKTNDHIASITQSHIYEIPKTNAHSFKSTTSSPSSNTHAHGRNYEHYQGYYKNPLEILNNTEKLKNNSLINYGNLDDFFDVITNSRPKKEALVDASKKEASKKQLENSILEDIQKHLGAPADLHAESSMNIHSIISHEEAAPIINTTNKDMKAEDFDKFTNNLEYENNTSSKVEIRQSIESTSASTTVSSVPESRNKKLDTTRRKSSSKARKGVNVNATETATVSNYLAVQRTKKVGSENTSQFSDSINRINATETATLSNYLALQRTNKVGYENTSQFSDSINRNQIPSTEQYSIVSSTTAMSLDLNTHDQKQSSKENLHDNVEIVIAKDQMAKNGKETRKKVAAKIPESFLLEENTLHDKSTTAPVISTTVEPKKDSFPSLFSQHNSNLDMFDFFNNLDSFYLNKNNSKQVDTTESNMQSSTTTDRSIKLPSTTTDTSPSGTIADFVKPLRNRGSIRASLMFPEEVDSMDDITAILWRNMTTSNYETTTELIIKRKPLKSQIAIKNHTNEAANLEKSTEILTNKELIENNVDRQPERKKYSMAKRNFTRPARKQSDQTKSKAENANLNNKENELSPLRMTQKDASTNILINSTSTPPPRRTMKPIRQLERVKIRNLIKEKMENSNKRNVTNLSSKTGLYNHKNGPSLVERKLKNKERLLSLARKSTAENSTTTDPTTTEEN